MSRSVRNCAGLASAKWRRTGPAYSLANTHHTSIEGIFRLLQHAFKETGIGAGSARLRLQVGVLVEHREHRLARLGRQREDQPVDAEVEELLGVLRVRTDAEHRDGKFAAA